MMRSKRSRTPAIMVIVTVMMMMMMMMMTMMTTTMTMIMVIMMTIMMTMMMIVTMVMVVMMMMMMMMMIMMMIARVTHARIFIKFVSFVLTIMFLISKRDDGNEKEAEEDVDDDASYLWRILNVQLNPVPRTVLSGQGIFVTTWCFWEICLTAGTVVFAVHRYN